ncbi:hypothetical protein N7534_003738 [Penicillium rubens]|nr:hypothetical protein N7534_003738 [Penicillium rubens]
MRNVQPLALPHHLFTTLALIEQAFGHSRPTEASTRWFIDSVTLNAYMTATSKFTNVQPLNVQCERIYSFGPVPQAASPTLRTPGSNCQQLSATSQIPVEEEAEDA